MDRNVLLRFQSFGFAVALRKESVDRNVIYLLTASAFLIVALRKESVDRNKCSLGNPRKKPCRSPQGERG